MTDTTQSAVRSVAVIGRYVLPPDYGPMARAAVPLVFTDCETDGLHRTRRPWEIAGIRREPDGTMTALHLMVADVHLAHANHKALRIGRFHERHPQARELCERYDLPIPPEGLPAVAEPPHPQLVSELDAALAVAELTRGAHIIGAVPNFDVATYQAMLDRHGARASRYHDGLHKGLTIDTTDVPAELMDRYIALGDTPELLTWGGHYHLVDVENLVAGRLGLVPPYDSEALSRAIGVPPLPPEQRHTALGDALWGMRMFDAVMGDRHAEIHPSLVPYDAMRMLDAPQA